jgi:hypothetical protein
MIALRIGLFPHGRTGKGTVPLEGDFDVKYMLLIYLDEQALSESERQKCYAESDSLPR